MKVREIMHRPTVYARAEATDCQLAAQLMMEHSLSSLPVLDGLGRLVGMLTSQDFCCRMLNEDKSLKTPVREVMSPPPPSCREEDEVEQVEAMVARLKLTRVPAVDAEGRLVGFVEIDDLIQYCQDHGQQGGLTETLQSIADRL